MFDPDMNDRHQPNRQNVTLEEALEGFLHALSGRNLSLATSAAYRADVGQFIAWLHDTNAVAHSPADVDKLDVTEYMSHLAVRHLTGVSRARKLAAIREYFRHLVDEGRLAASPAEGIATPKRVRSIP
jgi:site-specific recombinase XerD